MIEYINSQGGVLGGRPLKLSVRDIKSDPALVGTAAQELIDEGVVAILGAPTDDTMIPAGVQALPHMIPIISVASTQVQWPAAMPEIGFLTPYGDNAAAAAAAELAYEKGYRTAYMLTSHDIGSYSYVTPRYMGEAFERLGGTVVGEMNWNYGTADYSAQVTEFANMNPRPDVIFSAMIIPDGGVFLKQMHAAGVNIPMFTTDGMDDPGVLEIGGAGAELLTFATHGFPEPGSKLEWFKNYCEEKGYTYQNIFFGLGGETVEIIRRAIEAAGSAEPAAITEAMHNLENVEGITAKSITFKGHGGVPYKDLVLVTVKDGKFTLVKHVLPGWIPDDFSKWEPKGAQAQ
jgi:branched-chain amino acid transport system substrate-binding protein